MPVDGDDGNTKSENSAIAIEEVVGRHLFDDNNDDDDDNNNDKRDNYNGDYHKYTADDDCDADGGNVNLVFASFASRAVASRAKARVTLWPQSLLNQGDDAHLKMRGMLMMMRMILMNMRMMLLKMRMIIRRMAVWTLIRMPEN